MTALNELQDAVHKGAEWLDHSCPEWYDMIDTEALHLGSMDECILGQLGILNEYSIEWMRYRGFWGPPVLFYWFFQDRNEEDVDVYDVMTDMWKYEIAQRV